MWNTHILVKWDDIYSKSSLEGEEKITEGSLKMHTDEERGFHADLFLIIYISFLYMLRSGLLNMWRQGNGGFASRNTVLILHEL